MKSTTAGRNLNAAFGAANSRARTLLSFIACSILFSFGANAQTIYSDPADLSLKLNLTDGVTVSSNGPNEAANPVGKSGAGLGFDRAAVFVFQLPDLGAVDNPFGSATLGLFQFQDTMTGGVNGDLYGLGRREFSEVLVDDYYGRDNTPDPTDATLIQDDYLTAGGSPVDSLVTTSANGSEVLTEYLNDSYEGGVGIGQYVFLRVNTDAETTRRWNFHSTEGASGDSQTPQITYILASEPVETIQVETQNDGNGTAIPAQTLDAGDTLTFFSIARDAGGVFVDNVPATWAISNATGGVLPSDLAAAGDGKSAAFTASAPGTAEITIGGNASNLVGTGTLTVIVGEASQVLVETSPDGFGEPIADRSLILDESLTAFAVSRDAGGNFIASVPAVWSLEEMTGGIVAGDIVPSGDGTSATLTGTLEGSARIRATVGGLTSVDSGVIVVTELVSRWEGTGANANFGTAENWFIDIAPAFDNTTDLIFHDPSNPRLNPYFGEDRTIRSLTYNADADQNLNLGLTTNGTTGAASVTFDTDSETDPAEIVVEADAGGNFRLGRVLAPDVNEYGGIILADDLLVTHNGTGTLTLDGDITEDGDPKNVTKAGTGTVVMTGNNSYTGNTTVTGGVLSVNGTSLPDEGNLMIEDDGMVEVEGNETVGNLFLGGARKSAGIYGSSISAAPPENQDDTRFLGSGTVTVVAVSTGPLEILSIAFDGTDVTLTWNSNTGETYSIFYSVDLSDFSGEVEDGVPAGAGNTTEFTFPLTRVPIANLPRVFFRLVRDQSQN